MTLGSGLGAAFSAIWCSAAPLKAHAASAIGSQNQSANSPGRSLDLARSICPPRLRAARVENFFMSTTFDTVANIIAETCDIPRENIKPESHAIDDLGIDSLDFLDIAFAIDKAFGIKLPLEQWTQEVNEGKATTEQYFVLKNLCERIDELKAAKGA
jgi:acyl carrier protein